MVVLWIDGFLRAGCQRQAGAGSSETSPGILIYCADYRCSHSIAMPADRWADDVRLSDIEFICRACGKRSAAVRPHFQPVRMGTRA